MYNPISFNVIRQALRWSNMPTPVCKRESTFKLPDGTVTAQYSLTFKQIDVDNWCALHVPKWNGGGIAQFATELNDCFCADIAVSFMSAIREDGTAVAFLHVRLPKRDGGAK